MVDLVPTEFLPTEFDAQGCAFVQSREITRHTEMYRVALPSIVISQFKVPGCSLCGKPVQSRNDGLLCKRCKATQYCSENCQRADWKFHKYVCELRKAELKQAEAFVKESKIARCGNCHEPAKEGSPLLICTGCRCIQYCSRECQLAPQERQLHRQECWLGKSVGARKCPAKTPKQATAN